MHIGQKVVCQPVTLADQLDPKKSATHKPQTGKIIYIHPSGRWIMVAFGLVRECFFVWDVLQFGR